MKEINILYASDECFAEIMGTSIVSLLENNFSYPINIYVASQDIKESSKSKLKDMVGRYKNAHLSIVEVPNLDEILGEDIDIKRYSRSMFSRLLCGSLLPKNVSRVLYIDCDTIVLGDVNKFFCLDLHKKTIAAVNDCRNKRYNDNLGMKNRSIYINSGVLLIDVTRYRQCQYEQFLIDKIKKHNGQLEFPDNDIICRYLEDDILIIPPKYNATSVLFSCNWKQLQTLRKPHKCFSEAEYTEAITSPIIVHFTTCFLLPARPWYHGYLHKYAETYIHYREMTPWKDNGLWIYNPSFKKKIINSIIKLLPKDVVVLIAGCLHSTLNPMLQKKVDTHEG